MRRRVIQFSGGVDPSSAFETFVVDVGGVEFVDACGGGAVGAGDVVFGFGGNE